MASRFKKCMSAELRYKSKPPKTEREMKGMTDNAASLRVICNCLAVLDRLLIAYHLPKFLHGVHQRFRFRLSEFAKDMLLHAKETAGVWREFQQDLRKAGGH
jgi:hypothetical protein